MKKMDLFRFPGAVEHIRRSCDYQFALSLVAD